MFRKLCYVLGIAMMLSSTALAGSSPADSTEHHTGVKRTYHKVKHKVRSAANTVKTETKEGVSKVKRTVRPDDQKEDNQERK